MAVPYCPHVLQVEVAHFFGFVEVCEVTKKVPQVFLVQGRLPQYLHETAQGHGRVFAGGFAPSWVRYHPKGACLRSRRDEDTALVSHQVGFVFAGKTVKVLVARLDLLGQS